MSKLKAFADDKIKKIAQTMICVFDRVENIVRKGENAGTKRQNFTMSKSKAFVDDKIKIAQAIISVFDGVENMVEKGEKAGYQHFLLFPQCFQKALSSESFKVGIV